MRNGLSIRDFVAGAILGLLLGSASLSTASMGYQAWNRLSSDFKVGYVTGFLSLATLARNLDPGGWVDAKYPAVPNTTPLEWTATVDKLYKNPENQVYSIHSILQAAAHDLQKTHGQPVDPYERTKQRAQADLEKWARKKREATGEKPGDKSPSEPKQIQAPERKVAAPAMTAKPSRKWCRCDGKDPKAERARRRAEAAKKSQDEKAADGAKSEPEPAKQAAPVVK